MMTPPRLRCGSSFARWHARQRGGIGKPLGVKATNRRSLSIMRTPTGPPPDNGELTYTIAEVAKRHRVTPKTTRAEIKRGRLEAIKVGRLQRITSAALARYERGDWK